MRIEKKVIATKKRADQIAALFPATKKRADQIAALFPAAELSTPSTTSLA